MPIKRPEPGRRRCPGRDGRRLQEAFAKPEDVHDSDDYPHTITARRCGSVEDIPSWRRFLFAGGKRRTPQVYRGFIRFSRFAPPLRPAEVRDRPRCRSGRSRRRFSKLRWRRCRGRRACARAPARRSGFRASERQHAPSWARRVPSGWERPINRARLLRFRGHCCPDPARSVGILQLHRNREMVLA